MQNEYPNGGGADPVYHANSATVRCKGQVVRRKRTRYSGIRSAFGDRLPCLRVSVLRNPPWLRGEKAADLV